MVAMGPRSPSEKEVDKIYKQIVKIFKSNHILSCPPLHFKKICRSERRKLYKRLRSLVRDFIQQDIYENW